MKSAVFAASAAALLLTACGGGGGGSTSSGSGGTVSSASTSGASATPTVKLVSGTTASSLTTDVKTSAAVNSNAATPYEFQVSGGTVNVQFKAQTANGQPDTATVSGITLDSTGAASLSSNSGVFYVTVTPGDTLTVTVTDPSNSSASMPGYVLNQQSLFAGAWSITYGSNGTCTMNVTNVGAVTGSCSDSASGTYTISGQDVSGGNTNAFNLNGSNGYVFANTTTDPVQMGSWGANSTVYPLPPTGFQIVGQVYGTGMGWAATKN